MKSFHSMLKKAKEKESEQSLKYYKMGFDNAYNFILKNGIPDKILNEK